MLASGQPLSAATAALCERWQPGVTLIPMTDDRAETHVILADGPGQPERAGEGGDHPGRPGQAGARRSVHFQEWWVRLHASVPATDIIVEGAAQARPAPGV